ncbi:MAG: hypothetical protein ACKOQM_07380 [Novosphingobium sp.]
MNSLRIWLSVIAAPILIGAAHAKPKPPMLPASTNDSSLDILYEVGERPIWQTAQSNHRIQYRLSLIGINCRIHVVTFSERNDGSASGEFKVWNRCSRDDAYDAQSFRLSASKFASVKAAMAKAGLWQKPASYWTVQPDEAICVDGIDATFERRDASDYQMDQSNVWCETTADFVLAAHAVLEAAGDKDGFKLLPDVKSTATQSKS